MFKYLIVLAVGTTYPLTSHAQNPTPMPTQKRIILVFESTPDSNFYNDQKAIEAAHTSAFEERDLVILKVEEEDLYSKYGVSRDKNVVLLIGKDGGVKVQQHYIFEASELFRIIDAMPMRREEMKRQKN